MIWGSTPAWAKYISPLQNVQTGSGVNGDNFPGITLSEQETDHSLPSGTKVRRSGTIPLLVQLDYMVWTGETLPFTSTSFAYGIKEYHRHTETNMTSSTI
jgi:hypothetical protein